MNEIENEAKNLVREALSIVGQFDLDNWNSAGAVGAALRTKNGSIYTGICLDLACGVGFCAEHSAIAEMLKQRERVISMIVAVNDEEVMPPCGRCRELMAQVSPENMETLVVLPRGKILKLAELLPHHWL